MGIFKWIGNLAGGEVGRAAGRAEYDRKSFIGKLLTLQTREGYAEKTAQEWAQGGKAFGRGVDFGSGDIGDVVLDVVEELLDD